MRRLFTLLIAFAFTCPGFSQVPEKMSYQAVIRNSSDELVKSSTIGMQISILQGSESGSPIYVETHSTSTNNNGLVSVEIGGGTPVTGTFSDIDWSTGLYFLKTETDPAGGTSYSITGTSQLLSVPYALYAKNADDLMPRMEALEQAVFPAKNGFYSIKTGTDELYFIDFEDHSITMIGNIGLTIEDGFFGMQYIDHKLYLCKGGNLYSYDLPSGTLTHIIQNDHLSWQFSINSLGELYTVRELSGMAQGSMYKIDINSNTATLIGTTGTPSIWGMGFDSEDQLWAVDEFYGTYGTMDTTTGRFTQYSSSTGFPNFQYTNPDNNGNIYSTHGGTVNGIVKYNISSDLASLMIPLEQGMWLGLAYSTEVADHENDQITTTKEEVDILKAQLVELKTQVEMLQIQTGTHIKDIDGNTYKTATIGDQVWMAENLKTSRYNNGDFIESSIPATLDISTEINPKYQWTYNGEEGNVAEYGRLYTWYTITDDRKVCPSGWHIPDNSDWLTLTNYIGGSLGTSIKLKEVGTLHWPSSNTDATNEYGFTALPGGYRATGFDGLGLEAYWWSSNEANDDLASVYWIISRDNNFGSQSDWKYYGHSVRCIKD